MKKKKKGPLLKEAHANTYLIANLTVLFVMWVFAYIIIWFYLPFWWIVNFFTTLVVFYMCAWIEHKYLTKLVGRIVAQLWPDPQETARLQERYSKQQKDDEK